MSTHLRFPYRDMYRTIDVLEMLLRDANAPLWLKRPPRSPDPHRTLLYLGCHVLRVVHLAEACVQVFERLRVRAPEADFVTLGGPGFCCGNVQFNMGEPETGAALFGNSFAAFQRFNPELLVNWCPSCHLHLQRQTQGDTSAPFPMVHVTEYLAGQIHRLGPMQPQRRRVVLHGHTGQPQHDQDLRHVQQILAALPGVEVVKTSLSPELVPMGSQCTRSSIRRVGGQATYQAVLAAEFARARALGADAICTVYHGCHRELVFHEAAARRQGEDPVQAVHWITLLAGALGIPSHDRARELAHTDIDQTLQDLLPRAEALGVSRAEAEAVLRLEFEHHEVVGDPRWWSSAI